MRQKALFLAILTHILASIQKVEKSFHNSVPPHISLCHVGIYVTTVLINILVPTLLGEDCFLT